MELIDIDQNEIEIGENESQYIRESVDKDFLTELSGLEFDLYRISKATKDIVLKKNSNYLIKAKILYQVNSDKNIFPQIKLKEIRFVTRLNNKSIKYQEKIYYLSEKSRIIKFHSLGQNISKRFVIDYYYLESILEELKAPTFTVSVGRSSDVSTNDILSIFENEEINEIFCHKKSDIMTIENFRKRNIPEDKKYIKDINLNSNKYFGIDANNIIIFPDEYQNHFTEISKSLFSINETVIFFLGPKRCSKSIFLGLLTSELIDRDWGKLYINMKYIKEQKNALETKKVLYKEFLYAALKENDVQKIYNWRIFDSVKIRPNTQFINELIKAFVEFHIGEFSTKLVVIIDNYIIEKENEQTDLENIIDYFKRINKNYYKLIVSGEGKLFNQKIKHFFLREKDHLRTETLIFMHLNAFPEFIVGNDNEKKIRILAEEEVYLKKFSFHSLFHCYNCDDKVFSPKEFRNFNFFESFPNYLNIFYTENNIKLSLASKIFEEALNSEISFEIQSMSLTYLMNRELFPRSTYGIAEELLIILLLKYNKFKILYLDFKKKNFLEVEEINKIKDNQTFFNNQKIILEKNECYLITQKKYNGENYDILIIQKIDNEVNAIFIQIGVDKSEAEIQKHLTNLKDNIHQYKKGLKVRFDFDIDKFYLMYIFDEETQRTQNIGSNGSSICLNNDIDFLVYSFQDTKIKFTTDLKNYFALQYFKPKYEVTEKTNTQLN